MTATRRPATTAKVARLDAMVAALLSEFHSTAREDTTLVRTRQIHHRAVLELHSVLPPGLVNELRLLGLDRSVETSTRDEVRVAHAQLLGWMEGVLLERVTSGATSESKDEGRTEQP